MHYEIEGIRSSSPQQQQSDDGEFKAPEGAFLTSINTETGIFTYSHIEVKINDDWYPISALRSW